MSSLISTALRPAALMGLGLLLACNAARGQDRVRGHLLLFNDNGAWCWFEDERAVVDPFTDTLLAASCADGSGSGGSARNGDIDVAVLELGPGRTRVFELHDRLQADDHNSPALLVRPDGRYLAMYGTHGSKRLSYWRVSTDPGDARRWSALRTLSHPAGVTYANLHYLRAARSGQGQTFNFTRSVNFDPNVMVSNDLGTSWTLGGKLLTEGGGGDRPYLKYTSDGQRRIHLITTERHPRDYDNSIYHGYVEGVALHDSTGTIVDLSVLDANGVSPTRLTPVFRAGTSVGGTVMRRAWTIDLGLDDKGLPLALFQVRANDLPTDHRLFFARFDGQRWQYHQVCRLGDGLYSPERDYTGLAALHPDDPKTIYVSTRVDPRTNASLGHHEIFHGVTSDGGRNWSWTPVTEDSSVDNLRPIVPAWGKDRTALLWMRGRYSSYTNYDLAIVGTIDAPELRFQKIDYVDATRTNTTLATGATFRPTGPGPGQGAADGRWHERTGFGNGGSVFTADERGGEDVPTLRTRVSGVAPGRYDVFLLFWSNPAEDWRLQAGFATGALRTFEKRGSEAAAVTDFTKSSVVRTGPTVLLYKAWVGRTVIDSTGRLDVYIDDLNLGEGGHSRSWYDGIGIAPAPCEANTNKLGTGCGKKVPELSAVGRPVLGKSFTLNLSRGTPRAPAWLVLGIGRSVPLDLSPLGLTGCTLYPSLGALLPWGTLSATGSASPLVVALPNALSLSCLPVHFQGVVAPSGTGLELSAGLRAALGG